MEVCRVQRMPPKGPVWRGGVVLSTVWYPVADITRTGREPSAKGPIGKRAGAKTESAGGKPLWGNSVWGLVLQPRMTECSVCVVYTCMCVWGV